MTSDDDMTAEEFDARAADGEPVALTFSATTFVRTYTDCLPSQPTPSPRATTLQSE